MDELGIISAMDKINRLVVIGDTLENFLSKVAFEKKFCLCHENFRNFSPFESSFQLLAQVLFRKVFFHKRSAVIGRESVCCEQHRVDGR